MQESMGEMIAGVTDGWMSREESDFSYPGVNYVSTEIESKDHLQRMRLEEERLSLKDREKG